MTNEEKIRAIWKSASFCASPYDWGFANKLMCEKLGHSESISEIEPFWLMLYPLGMRQQILLEELERLMDEKELERLMNLKRAKEYYDELSRYCWMVHPDSKEGPK